MATQTDVRAKYVSSTGQAGITTGGQRVRIKGWWIAHTVTAGSVVFRDGGASPNPVVIQIDTGAAVETMQMLLPGEGVLFQGDPHLTLTNVTSVTLFYG